MTDEIDIWEHKPPLSRVIKIDPARPYCVLCKKPGAISTYWIIIDELVGEMTIDNFRVINKPEFISEVEICYEVGDEDKISTAIGFIVGKSGCGIYHTEIEYNLPNGDKDFIGITIEAV